MGGQWSWETIVNGFKIYFEKLRLIVVRVADSERVSKPLNHTVDMHERYTKLAALNEAAKNKNEDGVLCFLWVKLHKTILPVPANAKEMSHSSQRALSTEQTNAAHR